MLSAFQLFVLVERQRMREAGMNEGAGITSYAGPLTVEAVRRVLSKNERLLAEALRLRQQTRAAAQSSSSSSSCAGPTVPVGNCKPKKMANHHHHFLQQMRIFAHKWNRLDETSKLVLRTIELEEKRRYQVQLNAWKEKLRRRADSYDEQHSVIRQKQRTTSNGPHHPVNKNHHQNIQITMVRDLDPPSPLFEPPSLGYQQQPHQQDGDEIPPAAPSSSRQVHIIPPDNNNDDDSGGF
ncbi:hypothetical protein ACA910_016577 [Epithemia clementina (nom. ined.)]